MLIKDKNFSNEAFNSNIKIYNFQFQEAFENSDDDRETFKNNILLFTCALIPKAVGSLLSSFMDTSILW